MISLDPLHHFRRTADAAGVIPRHGKNSLHDDVWFVVHCMDKPGWRTDETVGAGMRGDEFDLVDEVADDGFLGIAARVPEIKDEIRQIAIKHHSVEVCRFKVTLIEIALFVNRFPGKMVIGYAHS